MAGRVFSDSDFAIESKQTTGGPRAFSDSDFDETLPTHANGLTPDAPLNESPLSAVERFKLSTGQVGGSMSGNLKWLSDRYGSAGVSKDRDGNIVVKDSRDGLWKQIDEQDSWSVSAAIGDLADVAPMAIDTAVDGIIGALGTAASASTGGAAAPASLAAFVATQGIQAEARASLGKLWGTYQPQTAAEELSDVGLEMLFSAGAGKVLKVGQRPTAGALGDMFEQSAPGLKKLDQGVRNTMKTAMGYITDTSPELIDDVIDESKAIGAFYKSMGENATDSQAIVKAKNVTTRAVQKISSKVQDVLSATWRSQAKEIENVVGDKVAIDGKGLYSNVISSLQESGLVKVVGADGAEIPIQALRDGSAKDFVVKLMKDDELAKSIGPLYHAKLPGMITELVESVKGFQHVGVNKAGESGVERLMKLRSSVANTLDAISYSARDEHLSAFARITDGVARNADTYIEGGLGPQGAAMYRAMRSEYAQLKDQFKPLLAVWTRYMQNKGNDAYLPEFEALANKFLSKESASGTKRELVSQLVDRARSVAPETAAQIERGFRQIRVARAAAAFAPKIKPNQWKTPAIGLVGAGMLTGNLPLAVSALLPIALTSPRLTAIAAPKTKAVYDAAINGARTVRSTLGRLTGAGHRALWSNPVIANQLMMAPLKSIRAAEGAQSQLDQQIQGVVNGGQ